MSSEKINFKGLHALRFFAASLVIIHHVEQYKSWKGLSSAWGNSVINGFGHASVSFFFVLSGFLITYLLLAEQRSKGSIDIIHFYWKRVLRMYYEYMSLLESLLLKEQSVETRRQHYNTVEIAFQNGEATYEQLMIIQNQLLLAEQDLTDAHIKGLSVKRQIRVFLEDPSL